MINFRLIIFIIFLMPISTEFLSMTTNSSLQGEELSEQKEASNKQTLFQKAKEAIKKHPYLTAASITITTLAAIIATLYLTGKLSKKQKPINQTQSRAPASTQPGQKVTTPSKQAAQTPTSTSTPPTQVTTSNEQPIQVVDPLKTVPGAGQLK